jgi:hypothetical protein
MRDFDWVRFQATGGTGPNVGLLELEVLARPDWIDTQTGGNAK